MYIYMIHLVSVFLGANLGGKGVALGIFKYVTYIPVYFPSAWLHAHPCPVAVAHGQLREYAVTRG